MTELIFPSLAQEGELDARDALGLGPLPTMTPAFDVSGDVSEAALATAFATVVRRHAPLRSVLLESELQADPAEPSWQVRVDRPESAFVDYWSTADEKEFRHALSVSRIGIQSPIAATVLNAHRQPARLVLTIDHLAFDGVSLVLLTDEMNQILDNLRAGSAPDAGLPVIEQHYYALAQSERAAIEPTLAECLPYWRDALADSGAYPPVELPGLDPEPADQPLPRAQQHVSFDGLAPFLGFCQARQATPFVVFQAALAAAISRLGGRYTGANSKAAYRTDPRSWHLIGYFSNLITFAPAPPEDPADPLGWIATLRRTAIEAVGQSLVPRATLLRRLYPDSYPARPEAPHLNFELDSVPPSGSTRPALTLLPPLAGQSMKAHAGLECTAVLLPDCGVLRVAYQEGACTPAAVDALLEMWLDIVVNEMAERQ
ncbi:MAG TPA: condensation domain-containing protein [Pseudonocardiaceae bacterium]